jgi:hypothetical protein
MKAERRHEMQQNALATKTVELPSLGRVWMGRAAMALAALAVVAAFIVSRVQRSHQQALDAGEFLAEAQQDVQGMRTAAPRSQFEPPALDASFMGSVQSMYDDGKLKLQQAVDRMKDHDQLGQATLLRGDLNLALAVIPAIPGATTQPTLLSPRPSREDAYTEAAAAYKEVVDRYGDQPVNVVLARLGLATIAENKRDFQAARDQYQAVSNDPRASAMFQQFAKGKLDGLASLEAPPLIEANPVPALPVAASTQGSAATTPATAATTQASAAAAPATTRAAK